MKYLLFALLLIGCTRTLEHGQPNIQGVDSIRLSDRTILTYKITAPGKVRAAFFEDTVLEPIPVVLHGSYTRPVVGFPGRWVIITMQGDTLRTDWGEY